MSPTKQDLELLIQVARHQNLHNDWPTNSELEVQLRYSKSTISKRVKKLMGLNFLRSDVTAIAILTPKARKFLEEQAHSIPTCLKVPGKVIAGKGKLNNFVTMESDWQDDSCNTISIPEIDIKQNSTVFALEVTGDSMVDEHILPGDYVIAQSWDDIHLDHVNDGVLVIAKYLPENFLADEEDVYTEDDYEGPTLKYYYRKQKGYYRLSTRKDFRKNKYTIRTKAVKIIATVIGIHREYG